MRGERGGERGGVTGRALELSQDAFASASRRKSFSKNRGFLLGDGCGDALSNSSASRDPIDRNGGDLKENTPSVGIRGWEEVEERGRGREREREGEREGERGKEREREGKRGRERIDCQ